MKTYPYSAGHDLPVSFPYASKKLILFFLFLILTVLSFAQTGSGAITGGGNSSSGGLLKFTNSVLVSGTAGAVGAVYKFPQVTGDIDALVKIKSRSNSLVYLKTIDMTGSGFEKAWQPQVGYNNGSAPGAADWWMEFEVSFVNKNTGTANKIDEFNLSAIDIDGNGHRIHEYVSFYGLTSYTLEANSLLQITDLTGLVGAVTTVLGKRFDGPTTNFTDIDTIGTSVMTTAKYLNTHSFTVRTGGVSSGASGASERMYSLYFQNFRYNQPQQATLPVSLKSFDAKLVSTTAVLNWTAETESNFSHYIVEKSNDGKEFSNLTMIFGADGANSSGTSYSYSESLEKAAGGLVYYRLKMVDIDGSYKYSHVRILKLHKLQNSVAISTYPNPVTSELRITIPDNWQDQKVVYDMLSPNGRIVKRVVNNRASQTETINMNDVNAGTYVIRLTTSEGSAVQQIVKMQ